MQRPMILSKYRLKPHVRLWQCLEPMLSHPVVAPPRRQALPLTGSVLRLPDRTELEQGGRGQSQRKQPLPAH